MENSEVSNGMKTIVLGGGCFWCIEAVYQRVKGVEEVESGYAGGGTEIVPSYWDLHSGKYGHAEVVKVTYDPKLLSLEKILEIFFYSHDPTVTRQPGTGDDGPEYRSIILCDKEELKLANSAKENAQKLWDDPILTEVVEIDKFYAAEDNHQNFYNNNPNVGYCQVIINPKIAKFEKKFKDILKI
jgi:methionine-S-sulfoxide reductase